jgi:leucyl/phenylalanyl-tRNA--protein transferase
MRLPVIRLPVPWLGPEPDAPFPAPERALRRPDGLLAAGGDLSVPRLLHAYRHGVFPWYGEGEPILWWCPDPRAVFATDGVRLPSKFRRQLRHSDWTLRADHDFDAVIAACASTPRPGQHGTWITPAMAEAYRALHRAGHAHSLEVMAGDRLVGGLYGVAIGRMFFGESMFSRESGASKLALAGLARVLHGWGWPLLDAQVGNAHTGSLGATSMARPEFLAEVRRLCALPDPPGHWRERFPALEAAELSTGAAIRIQADPPDPGT